MRTFHAAILAALLLSTSVMAEEAMSPEEALASLGSDPQKMEEALAKCLERARARVEEARAAGAGAAKPDAPSWKKETTQLALSLAEEEEKFLTYRVNAVRSEMQRRTAEADAEQWKTRLPAAEKELEGFLSALEKRDPDKKELDAAEEDVASATKADAAAKEAAGAVEGKLASVPAGRQRIQGEIDARGKDLARAKEEKEPKDGKEAQQAKLPLLEKAVRLAEERLAFVDRREKELLAERDTRHAVLANTGAVLRLATQKRDALKTRIQGAVTEEDRRKEREKELANAKAAVTSEQQANGELKRLVEEVEGRLAQWKKEHTEFLATVVSPSEGAIARERAAGTTTLAPSEHVERLKTLDEELGKLDVRASAIEEELGKLRPEQDDRLTQTEAGVAALRKRIEEMRAGCESHDKAMAADPVLAQTCQEGLQKLDGLARERQGMLDRLKAAYEKLVAELEAYKKDVQVHRRAVAAWRESLAASLARGRTVFFGFYIPVNPWIGVPAVVLLLGGLVVLVHLGLRRVLMRRVVAAGSPYVKMILRLASQYALPILAIGGVWVLANGFVLPESLRDRANTAAFVLAVGTVTYLLSRVTLVLLQRRTNAKGPLQGPARTVVRIVFATLGTLVILDALHVSITPILTGLGVGSVAVALALQDTLSNFFAGIYVTADKPIQVGDYVRLDTGDEGYVVEISWRSTRLRTLSNNIVIVPNHKLGQCVITNYNLPESSLSVPVPLSVGAGEDAAEVEGVLLDEAKKASKDVEGMLREPAPSVRLIAGGGTGTIDFAVVCWIREFGDQYTVAHEVRKRILERLRKEGISPSSGGRTVSSAQGR